MSLFLNQVQIDKAAQVLINDGLLAFPTETVYGLGCISTSEKAFNKLVKIKKRAPEKPFTLMCSSLDQLSNYIDLSEKDKKIISKFMPGPLTLILKAKKGVPHYIDLGTGFIGFRIPQNEYALKLIDKVNVPLLVPSANVSTLPPALNDIDVYDYFPLGVDAIVKGECGSGVPSTVVKFNEKEFKIYREGPISLEDLKESIK